MLVKNLFLLKFSNIFSTSITQARVFLDSYGLPISFSLRNYFTTETNLLTLN